MTSATRSFILGSLTVAALSACAPAASVTVEPGAARVIVRNEPPPAGSEQLGAITAKHGHGCGLYGSEGNFEGAYTMLQNKAAALGADYVHIVRVVQPGRMEGICNARDYVIDGIAYRARRP